MTCYCWIWTLHCGYCHDEWLKHLIVLNSQFDSCRHLLLGSLFKLLRKVFSEEWVNGALFPKSRFSKPSSPSDGNHSAIYHIQQTLLIILEDIIISLKSMAPLNVCYLIMKLENLLCYYLIENISLFTFSLFWPFPYIMFHHCWQEKITNEISIKLLIECAQNSNVVVTRNHVFSLLSAVTKVFPGEVLEHMHDILAVIGEAAVTQVC